MNAAHAVEAKYRDLASRLDEATLRLWVAAEARSLGRGGVSLVAKAVGVSRTTVYAGLAEIEALGRPAKVAPVADKSKRIRAVGGGRKKLIVSDPTLLQDLDALVEPSSRGDPMSEYAGRARARPGWPKNSMERVTASVSAPYASCWLN